MLLTIENFEKISGLIYRRTGLRYDAKKMYFISKRIEKRLDALGLEGAEDYYKKLQYSDPRGEEIQNLIDVLTVNETYFFRDFPQMIAFAEHCLQDIAQIKRERKKRQLRIWSAGCSSGAEPYTLAIIFQEMLEDFADWDIKILATDIDRNIIRTARAATYDKSSLRDVPSEYLGRYFHDGANGNFQLLPGIRKMVTFEYLNLNDKSAIRSKQGFDFIFCRNVLIYFDTASRKQVVDHFYMSLDSGGYLFLGSSESVAQISTAFQVKRAGDHLVYFKK